MMLSENTTATAGEILRAYGTQASRRINFFLPVEKGLPIYHNIKSKIDWWKYEDLWRILKEDASQALAC